MIGVEDTHSRTQLGVLMLLRGGEDSMIEFE